MSYTPLSQRQVEMADLKVKAYPNGAVEFLLRDPQADAQGMKKARVLAVAAFAVALALWWKQQRLSVSLVLALGCALLAAAVYLQAQRAVVEESMLVAPALGIKLSKRHRNGSSSIQFLDRLQIRAVVVNETMTFADVVYYLAVMMKGHESMVLPFETFRPRVTVLQEILTKTQSVLFPDEAMQFPDAMGLAY